MGRDLGQGLLHGVSQVGQPMPGTQVGRGVKVCPQSLSSRPQPRLNSGLASFLLSQPLQLQFLSLMPFTVNFTTSPTCATQKTWETRTLRYSKTLRRRPLQLLVRDPQLPTLPRPPNTLLSCSLSLVSLSFFQLRPLFRNSSIGSARGCRLTLLR